MILLTIFVNDAINCATFSKYSNNFTDILPDINTNKRTTAVCVFSTLLLLFSNFFNDFVRCPKYEINWKNRSFSQWAIRYFVLLLLSLSKPFAFRKGRKNNFVFVAAIILINHVKRVECKLSNNRFGENFSVNIQFWQAFRHASGRIGVFG